MLSPVCSWLRQKRPEELNFVPRDYNSEGQEHRRGTECQNRNLDPEQSMQKFSKSLHANGLKNQATSRLLSMFR